MTAISGDGGVSTYLNELLNTPLIHFQVRVVGSQSIAGIRVVLDCDTSLEATADLIAEQ